MTALLLACGGQDRRGAERALAAYAEALAAGDRVHFCELFVETAGRTVKAREEECIKIAQSSPPFSVETRQRYQRAQIILKRIHDDSASGLIYWSDCRDTELVSLAKEDGTWRVSDVFPPERAEDVPPGCIN